MTKLQPVHDPKREHIFAEIMAAGIAIMREQHRDRLKEEDTPERRRRARQATTIGQANPQLERLLER